MNSDAVRQYINNQESGLYDTYSTQIYLIRSTFKAISMIYIYICIYMFNSNGSIREAAIHETSHSSIDMSYYR